MQIFYPDSLSLLKNNEYCYLFPRTGTEEVEYTQVMFQDEGFFASKRSRGLVETCHLETLNMVLLVVK
jgi:hypothetical protein